MTASCDARNVASERVMRKLGMQRDEGRETPGRRAYVISQEDAAIPARGYRVRRDHPKGGRYRAPLG